MTPRIALLTTVAFALLAGCASDPRNANQMAFEDAIAFNGQSAERLAKSQVELRELSKDEVRARLTDALSDVTAIVKQTGHGIYVEYTAPDGRLFMWYPGNAGTVAGTWGISDQFAPPRACFRYFAAYHGVSGEYEPNECVPAEQTLSEAYVIEKRKGDVFELRTKGIPYSKSAGNLPPWPEDWGKFGSSASQR
ncbi:MAG: hypothetical protein AAGA44_09315 [Pseudomonadota bacterium]